MLRCFRLSLLCTTVCYKQNKGEAVGHPILTGAIDDRCRHMGLCLIALLRPNKSRVFACVPVCCQTQALDCVCLECFPFAPWLREMICFTEFGLHVLPTLCVVMFLLSFTLKRGTKLSTTELCFPLMFLTFCFERNHISSHRSSYFPF